MENLQFSGAERSRAEYAGSPPNPKYADSPEYRDRPRYQPPSVTPEPTVSYQPPPFQPAYQPQPFVVNNVVVQEGPGFFARALWFVFIGWWLSILWLIAAYGFCATVIGLPLGLYMANRLPQVLTLRPRDLHYVGPNADYSYTPQVNFFLRAIYYLMVGWWLGIFWTMAAYGFCLLIWPLPLGLLMLNRLPAIMTLRVN